jgi:hypothetical protein
MHIPASTLNQYNCSCEAFDAVLLYSDILIRRGAILGEIAFTAHLLYRITQNDDNAKSVHGTGISAGFPFSRTFPYGWDGMGILKWHGEKVQENAFQHRFIRISLKF